MERKIIEITSLEAECLRAYVSLTDSRLQSECDLFIAESPKVIRLALDAGLKPVSMLCERRHISGDAADIIERCAEMPVYTGDRELLARLTGYTLTRGVLCAVKRPPQPSVDELLRDARRVVIIDNVCDATNTGAIFRSATALGLDAVLLTPGSCDPLNRRSVRTSMGTVLKMPWGRIADVSLVHEYGFKTVALALEDRSLDIDDPLLHAESRLALMLGTEGEGLDANVIKNADYTARIPMARGVDSLNVAAAAAVAFWELRVRD